MSEAERVGAVQAIADMRAGKALVVCAYDSEERCGQMMFEGAMSLGELTALLPSLPRDQVIYFYCA